MTKSMGSLRIYWGSDPLGIASVPMWELLLRGLHPRPTAEFPRGNQKQVPIDRKSRIYDDFTSFPRVQIPLSPPKKKPRICWKTSQIRGFPFSENAVQTARVTNFLQKITRNCTENHTKNHTPECSGNHFARDEIWQLICSPYCFKPRIHPKKSHEITRNPAVTLIAGILYYNSCDNPVHGITVIYR